MALLLQSELNFKRHSFNKISIVQYICVSISLNGTTILLTNIYSPFRFVVEANLELAILLEEIEKLNKDDIIILGDFNMPNIKWEVDEDYPGVYLPLGNEATDLFTNIIFDHNLVQILEPPLDRNITTCPFHPKLPNYLVIK